jgi:hypothetical protein
MATICNQPEADKNIPLILQIKGATLGLSIEPLLGPVDFNDVYPEEYFCPKCREFFKYPETWNCPNCGADTSKAKENENGQIVCNDCKVTFNGDEEEYYCPNCDNHSGGGRYIGPHPSETIMTQDIEGAVLEKLDWVVAGCESGPKRRPCKVEWIESIVNQCKAAGVDYLVKQVNIEGKVSHNPEEWPEL